MLKIFDYFENGVKMSNKIEFGCDFLALCGSMNSFDKTPDFTTATIGVACFLLTMWGFTPEEVDSSVEIYANRVEIGELQIPVEALKRIMNHISSNKTLQGQLISHLSAIGHWDFDYTEKEGVVLNEIGEVWEISKTDLDKYINTGANLAIQLRNFPENY